MRTPDKELFRSVSTMLGALCAVTISLTIQMLQYFVINLKDSHPAVRENSISSLIQPK